MIIEQGNKQKHRDQKLANHFILCQTMNQTMPEPSATDSKQPNLQSTSVGNPSTKM